MVKGAHLASATMPWHWLFFCPAPKVRAYFGRPVTKSLDSPKWYWYIFVPMGALGYLPSIEPTYLHITNYPEILIFLCCTIPT